MTRPLRWHHLIPLVLFLAVVLVYAEQIDRWADGVLRIMAGG